MMGTAEVECREILERRDWDTCCPRDAQTDNAAEGG